MQSKKLLLLEEKLAGQVNSLYDNINYVRSQLHKLAAGPQLVIIM